MLRPNQQSTDHLPTAAKDFKMRKPTFGVTIVSLALILAAPAFPQ